MLRLGELVKRVRAEAAATQPAAPAAAPPCSAPSAAGASSDDWLCAQLRAPLPAAVPPSQPLPAALLHCGRDGGLRVAVCAVNEATEAALCAWLREPARAWTSLKSRRVFAVGGAVGAAGLAGAAPLPAPLAALAASLVAAGLFPSAHAPNHVLVNEYAPGQGILPHTDGAAYWPRTATLSLGSHAVMTLSARGGADGAAPAPLCEVALPRRSLVVFDGAVYTDALHGIPPRAADVVGEQAPCVNPEHAPGGRWLREPRLSVTLRHVPPAAAAVAACAEGQS